jgi:hypothetical protein
MNPGGDFGKKELSPALANRFTVIWVPALEDEEELGAILEARLAASVCRCGSGSSLWLEPAPVGPEALPTPPPPLLPPPAVPGPPDCLGPQCTAAGRRAVYRSPLPRANPPARPAPPAGPRSRSACWASGASTAARWPAAAAAAPP